MPENLKVKYDALSTNMETDYAYSDIMVCDEVLNDVEIERGVPASEVRDAILTWQAKSIPGFSSNIMIRKKLIIDKDIYFDIHLSNCADRYYKILLSKESEGIYIPRPLIKYRNTPGSMSKKVFLLEHDELYILDRIKEKDIIPAGRMRNKVFAKVYLMLSGSWYKDAGEAAKAIKFAFWAFVRNPFILVNLLKKSGKLLKGV